MATNCENNFFFSFENMHFSFTVNTRLHLSKIIIKKQIKQQGGYKLQVELAQITHGEQLKESNNSFLTKRNRRC